MRGYLEHPPPSDPEQAAFPLFLADPKLTLLGPSIFLGPSKLRLKIWKSHPHRAAAAILLTLLPPLSMEVWWYRGSGFHPSLPPRSSA